MSASERRRSARTAVVWEVLERALARPGVLGEQGARILDVGGGTGGFAVRLAELGHRVTVVDPSLDALAALGRRAREVGVEVTGLQGDLADLPDLVDRGVDVVLCHGVLEVVGDPAAALGTIREVLRPGGTLSLLVAQRHAAVVARAMAGHFPQALALLTEDPDAAAPGRTRNPVSRFAPDEAAALLTGAGFEVASVHGIRVFADLVPGSLLDLEPGAAAALVELERAVSERAEYLPLATQLHLLATT
jgi:S-adenosylmethionine-dependent methyltransferase